MNDGSGSPARSRPRTGYLQVPLGALAVTSTCVALTCLAALVVVASLKDVQALATVALALAVIAFVAQLIVFVVQASTSNQQMLQSRELHSEIVRLLGEMGERTRGTERTVTTMNERLLEAALGKALGTGAGPGSQARDIASEVASLFDAEMAAEPAPDAGPVDRMEVVDEDARRRSRELLSTFPESEAEEALNFLEQLSPAARRMLKDFGEDEKRYAGTRIGVGQGADRSGGPELYGLGLISPRRPGASMYTLTDQGREVARLLLAEGEPPASIAARVVPLRREPSEESLG